MNNISPSALCMETSAPRTTSLPGHPVTATPTHPASLPPRDLLHEQSSRLSGVRSRLLRRAQIATRRKILDLGAGCGVATEELIRRGGGQVVSIDCQHGALAAFPNSPRGSQRICGDAHLLPFAAGQFDLVFAQFALLWMNAARAIEEVFRILAPEGVFMAIEPDFGGLIEHPPTGALKHIWLRGLERAGADSVVGRRLPGLAESAGFDVRVELVPELAPAEKSRFEMLAGLPLTESERSELEHLRKAEGIQSGQWIQTVYLPLFLITATKPLHSVGIPCGLPPRC